MTTRQSSVFGKRKEPHTVIIARGNQVRHFTIRPWIAALMGSALAAIAIGYLLATSYLVLRDDLIGASTARQARMQEAYEDRISMLRAQVDRITSRQLLDQQVVEDKVARLLERQTQLTRRHGEIGPMLERARGSADGLPRSAPLPERRPEQRADARPASIFARLIRLPAEAAAEEPVQQAFWPTAGSGYPKTTAIAKSDQLFRSIDLSLETIEAEQIVGIDALADETYRTTDTILSVLHGAGLSPDMAAAEDDGLGGPFVPVDDSVAFEMRVHELDEALQRLDTLKDQARQMPIFHPAPGKSVSSRFGVRRDPFIRRQALHAGIDFRATSGSPIRSAGAGTVTKAGWNGGYGRLVEVDHGHGLSTRYAHMSKVRVRVGQRVDTGDRLGDVGSSGRSTGPHLHYELRKNGKAVDPVGFLRAGREVADLL